MGKNTIIFQVLTYSLESNPGVICLKGTIHFQNLNEKSKNLFG